MDAGAKADSGAINSGTLIFENTAFKGGKADKLDKSGGPIQLPLSFSKQDSDNGDLKLDFTFGGEEPVLKAGAGGAPLLASRSGLPASPSTDDLQTKLAGTKKLWDQPGMPSVPENAAASNWNEAAMYDEGGADNGADASADKAGAPSVVSNVATVKPRQQQQQQQLGLDGDGRQGMGAPHYSRMAVPSPPGGHSGMPPSHLPPQPWAFIPGDRTSPMYNPYSLNQQSILLPGAHSMATDLFNSNNGGFRNQMPTFPGSGVGLTTTNNVLISQASLINSHGQNKPGGGIGPIGSKAGGGGAGSPYMQSLPNTNSNIFIQHPAAAYDQSGNPMGYMPPSHSQRPPQQTAFYHQLNRLNQQQAYASLQGFAGQQHALSQQQMRASAVAGLPFMKTDQAKSPVSMDSGFQAPGGPYNGRGGGVGAGPPSPKTKMKMAQQQEQAKINANLNNLNLNANLNANVNLLAQMQLTQGRGMGQGAMGQGGMGQGAMGQGGMGQGGMGQGGMGQGGMGQGGMGQGGMGMGQYGHIGGMVQPNVPGQYNPSPIARPQPPATMGPGSLAGAAGGKQINQYFSPEGAADTTEEVVAGEKACDGEVEAVGEGAAPAEGAAPGAQPEEEAAQA